MINESSAFSMSFDTSNATFCVDTNAWMTPSMADGRAFAVFFEKN